VPLELIIDERCEELQGGLGPVRWHLMSCAPHSGQMDAVGVSGNVARYLARYRPRTPGLVHLPALLVDPELRPSGPTHGIVVPRIDQDAEARASSTARAKA
jgi:hypothetical protein